MKENKDRFTKLPEYMLKKAKKPEELAESNLFLLRSLLIQKEENLEELTEEGSKIMDYAIFGAFTQCVDAGRTADALKIIEDVKSYVGEPLGYEI